MQPVPKHTQLRHDPKTFVTTETLVPLLCDVTVVFLAGERTLPLLSLSNSCSGIGGHLPALLPLQFHEIWSGSWQFCRHQRQVFPNHMYAQSQFQARTLPVTTLIFGWQPPTDLKHRWAYRLLNTLECKGKGNRTKPIPATFHFSLGP